MKKAHTKILFLNQMAGPLFRELAEDVSSVVGSSVLSTGHPHTIVSPGTETLTIKPAPGYDRRSNIRRLFSWIQYFFAALNLVLRYDRTAVLFIVSNPPFLGLLGYGFKRLRKQRYVVLVYDVYPDILLALGKLKDGIFANVWRRLNRFILEHADAVITIGHDMERVLEKHYNLHKTRVGKAVVIPNWADVEAIKPLAKEENWFARKHDLLHKTTVLYSGNMGNTHDIKGVLAVARLLKDKPHIHFLFIGEGAKWALVENSIQENGLNNITLLPFQPEEVLPFSMTTGDIGIVPYYPGTEGCIVPSKSYYYMAAGVVPVIISSQPNDLAEMVESRRCGFAVASGDPKMLADKILELGDDSARLKAYKEAARHVAEESYSRKNTSEFSRLISQLVLADE